MGELGHLDSVKLRAQFCDASLMDGLTDPQRQSLLGLMVQEEHAANDVIIRQETFTRNLWLLIEGECEVVKEPPIGSYGVSVSLAKLSPLDVFGEMTLVSPSTHFASIEACAPARTLRLRGADFDALVHDQPRLACRLVCNLLHILSERLRNVDERLTQSLDSHQERKLQSDWQDLRQRLGKLYGG